MKKISWKDKNFEKVFESLCRGELYPPEIEKDVREILERVRRDGDNALLYYAKKFDGADLRKTGITVPPEAAADAAKTLSPNAKAAIKAAVKNVSAFASRRKPSGWTCHPRPGVTLGERFEPLDRAGVYVPGGTAPLVSTVVHTAAIANAAGVPSIAACTPPGPDGHTHPAVLCAMEMSGVTEIYRLGGVYAVAAMAFGTETVKRVEKIVGPGNAYVTAAKKLVYGPTAIDMVAGPSEIMILADKTCDPEFAAADMLSQAEHGSGHERVLFVSDSEAVIDAASRALKRQAAALSRFEHIKKVLDKGAFFILAKSMDHAAELAGRRAPEHLELMCAGAEKLAGRIKAAGAVFIGQWTPEPVGDFCAGPSHVLPTAGTARHFSGLSIESFFRRTSLIKYSKTALRKELPFIMKFAEMEGLDAHGASAAARFK
jgi:histidinol dehydrogenase